MVRGDGQEFAGKAGVRLSGGGTSTCPPGGRSGCGRLGPLVPAGGGGFSQTGPPTPRTRIPTFANTRAEEIMRSPPTPINQNAAPA